MSASECSVVVGDQRALMRSVDEPVVPDTGREGEQPLSNANGDAGVGPAAVRFEAELSLEGVVDRLDALADPTKRAPQVSLIAPVRPDQDGAEFTDEVL